MESDRAAIRMELATPALRVSATSVLTPTRAPRVAPEEVMTPAAARGQVAGRVAPEVVQAAGVARGSVVADKPALLDPAELPVRVESLGPRA